MTIGGTIDSPLELALAAVLFLVIPLLTYFFASRRALFIRVFAPKSKREHLEQQLPKGKQFTKRMKIMAALQLSLPLAMLIGAVVWWYRR